MSSLSGNRPSKLNNPTCRPVVGVVGLGYWGPNLLRVLIERSDVQVRWVCDLDEDRLARYGRRYPSVRMTDDLDRLLDDDELDGILLATPVFTHYELAKRCLDAGKHVFVEKPLAPSSEQAGELIELAGVPRPGADVRPHVPLQPSGADGPGLD